MPTPTNGVALLALAKWYCSETTGGRCLVLPTLPTPRTSMSWWNGRAASTSMPRLSAMKYSAVMVGRTLLPTSVGGSGPRASAVASRLPLSDLGSTLWTPMPRVQSPLDWAAAGSAAAATRAASSRVDVRFMGSSLWGGASVSTARPRHLDPDHCKRNQPTVV